MAQPNMSHLHGDRDAVHHYNFVTPVELVSLARGKRQRNIRLSRRTPTLLAPSTGIAAHSGPGSRRIISARSGITFQDLCIGLRLPQHAERLALRIVVHAGEIDQSRVTGLRRRRDVLDDPVPLPDAHQKARTKGGRLQWFCSGRSGQCGPSVLSSPVSRADTALIAASGKATSMSFFRVLAVINGTAAGA